MAGRFNPVKIFACSASRYLGEKIALEYGTELGAYSLKKFADCELQPSIDESVRGCDVFIIQSTFAPAENLMELLLTIDASKRASAHSTNVVIPYFGYARQDRKDKPRVSIGAKLVADLIHAAGANMIMTMDLHAAQIQGFFSIPVIHLDSSIIFIPYIKSLDLDNLVLAAPDVGASKRVKIFADFLKTEIVLVDKIREVPNEVRDMRLIGDVTNKNVIIIDDMIDTGNTLMKAADLMLDSKAASVRAFATHPVFSDNALYRIENSKIKEVVICDTIPVNSSSPKINILSTSKLFAIAIRNVYEHRSISTLFDHPDYFQKEIKFKK